MTEAQKTLYYIAENMRMDKSISKEGYEHFQQAIKALEQEPKSEWERDHVILKAYSDGVNEVLDKIRAEIVKKHLSIVEKNGFDSGRTYGYEEVLDVIDKYKAESEQ